MNAPVAKTGRLLASATVNRQLRRSLNAYASQIANKLAALALAGNVQALASCADLLIAANKGAKDV